MWVNSKTAAAVLSVDLKAIQQGVYRATKQGKNFCSVKLNILRFTYLNGIGRGGKVLQIWIDDSVIAEFENKRSGGERSETGFCENKQSGDTHEVRGGFLAEQSEARQNTNGVRVSINGISHGCGGDEVVGDVRKNGDCVVGHAVGDCEIGGACGGGVVDSKSSLVGGLQNANLRVSENGIIQGGGAVMDGGVSANLHSRNATAPNNTISQGVGGSNLDNGSLNTGDYSASASPTQEMTAEPPVRSFSQNFVCFVPNDTRNDNRDGSVVGRGASYSKNSNSCVSGVVGGNGSGGANLQGRGAILQIRTV